MNRGMSASRLRTILIIAVILLIVIVSGGFWFIQRNLNAYASQISTMNADAKSGDANMQTLTGLGTRLEEEKSTIASARSLVADNATFSDLVVSDISRIAKESGVVITSFEFAEQADASTASPTVAAAPTAPGPAAPTTTTEAPSGVTKRIVTVTLESPLEYAKLMDFIRKIETNKLRMQFASVSITKDDGTDVATQTFSIEVNVRS
ncbi:hypothetical protein H7142_01635 [Candidatus Saccharibacteria bacterium]|nr:hypothetical protein [Candidatus Saccharibacteria bacterium]